MTRSLPMAGRNRASPKSSSFTPDFVSMTLPGLRSRCTIPAACAADSASRISMPGLQRLIDGSGSAAQSRGQRFAVDKLHDQVLRLDAGDRSRRRRRGACTRADASAARPRAPRARSARDSRGWAARSRASTLIATVRSSRVSRAR